MDRDKGEHGRVQYRLMLLEGANEYQNNMDYSFEVIKQEWHLIYLNFVLIIIIFTLVAFYIYEWKIKQNIIGQFQSLSTKIKIYSNGENTLEE